MPAATGTQDANTGGISILNRILSDKIMGVETPIPPIMIGAAAPPARGVVVHHNRGDTSAVPWISYGLFLFVSFSLPVPALQGIRAAPVTADHADCFESVFEIREIGDLGIAKDAEQRCVIAQAVVPADGVENGLAFFGRQGQSLQEWLGDHCRAGQGPGPRDRNRSRQAHHHRAVRQKAGHRTAGSSGFCIHRAYRDCPAPDNRHDW